MPLNIAYVVLLVLLIIYVPIWIWVWRCPEQAGRYHLAKYGPCIMIRTQLGMRTMDRLSRYTRFWRAFGFMSKVISAVLFFIMLYMVVMSVLALPSRIASGTSIGIEYALAIPGFNPILPLSYGVVALVVAMVVHELGHGIQARANGARVDSSGVLYGVVPLGAFVEPNEEDMSKKSRRAQMDMYTAGISVNTVVAVLCIALMIGSCGAVSSEYGDDAGVYYIDSGSPAHEAGIPASAIITGVTDASAVEPGADDSVIESLSTPTYTTVRGSQVSVETESGLDPTHWYYVVYVHRDVTYVTDEPIQLGAYVRTIVSGSPAQGAGIENGSFLYSITVNGGEETRVTSTGTFSDIMSSTAPGDTVVVGTVAAVGYGGEAVVTYSDPFQLADNGGVGYLGMSVSTGGMTCVTPDIMISRATDPFYGADTPYSYLTAFLSYLSGPFNGQDPVSDEIKWWYDTPMGDVFWVMVTLLYWLFWLNILLAISNALPAYPFDGGFIFAGGVSWLIEKLGVGDEERRQKLTDSIAGSVSTLVLFMFALVIVSFVI